MTRRPPPPAAGSPDSDDPFSEENAFSSNGPAAAATNRNDGFADFVSELSKREETERLQLQEEQELADAIALSKGEAASLNQQ